MAGLWILFMHGNQTIIPKFVRFFSETAKMHEASRIYKIFVMLRVVCFIEKHAADLNFGIALKNQL